MSEHRSFPFLSDNELKSKKIRWGLAADLYESESEGYNYRVTRTEMPGLAEPGLEDFHNESLIDWLKERVVQGGDKTVLNVLDVGGGAGFYAEQIRQALGEHVRVFTTGLRKEAAKKMRQAVSENRDRYVVAPNLEFDTKLKPDDLKWRSILQLSDYEEFDLIVDSMGEFAWATDTIEDIQRYCVAVIHKLKVGGRASLLVPSYKTDEVINTIMTNIGEQPTYSNTFSYTLNPSSTIEKKPRSVLKIDKVNSLNV